MNLRLLVLSLIFAASNVSAGNFMTGSKFTSLMLSFDRGLQRNSSSGDQADGIQGVAYLMGVHDLGESALFCTPRNVDVTQLVAVARKYISDKPERWNESASVLIAESFVKAFPCQGK